MVGGLRCVVIHVKCDPNRLRGYGAVGVENGPFLLLWPVAYTTGCTTVQAVINVKNLSV